MHISHISEKIFLPKPFLAALNLTQLPWTQMMFSFLGFFFFQPFFPVCVHDNKMAFTGNGMHFQMPGKEEG